MQTYNWLTALPTRCPTRDPSELLHLAVKNVDLAALVAAGGHAFLFQPVEWPPYRGDKDSLFQDQQRWLDGYAQLETEYNEAKLSPLTIESLRQSTSFIIERLIYVATWEHCIPHEYDAWYLRFKYSSTVVGILRSCARMLGYQPPYWPTAGRIDYAARWCEELRAALNGEPTAGLGEHEELVLTVAAEKGFDAHLIGNVNMTLLGRALRYVKERDDKWKYAQVAEFLDLDKGTFRKHYAPVLKQLGYQSAGSKRRRSRSTRRP